jgi:hypothetical protein
MFDPTNTRPAPGAPPAASALPATEAPVSRAVGRFNTCRWRSQDQGRFCTHRDVLPLSGKEGFTPDAWCGDCTFFKIRRTPRKREPNEFRY